MKAHMAIIQQQAQAQQLHDDQMKLAIGADTKKIGEPPGSANPAKPKQPEKIKTGAQGADRSPIG
jgi:hypothetical protein